MQFYKMHPSKVSSQMKKKLKDLSYRDRGWLSEMFSNCAKSPTSNSTVVYVTHFDKVIGWGLRVDKLIMFYVRKTERNKGIGKKLLKILVSGNKIKDGIRLEACTDNSPHFWNSANKQGFRFSNYYDKCF